MSLLTHVPSGVLGSLAGVSQTFVIERLTESATKGRAAQSWASTGDSLSGVLSQAKAADVDLYSQRQIGITHILAVNAGRADLGVKSDDRLISTSGIRYWVVDVIDPNGLGIFTRLTLDERSGPEDGTP